MIETIDANLKAWALRETGAAAVSFGPVAAGTQTAGTQNVGAQGLQFTLLDLLPFPAPRGPIPVPYRYTLRYLVTVTAATPEAAHAQLSRVLLAAMKDPEMQEELGPVSPALFQALGWPPQPAFYLRVPVSVPADYTPAPLAREHVLNLRPWPFQATDAPERSTTDAPALSNTDAASDRPNPG